MKFTQPGRRLLAAGLGTAVLGAAAIAAAVATASPASRAHTATLDAAAQAGPTAVPKPVPASAQPRPVRAKRATAQPVPVPSPSSGVVGRVVASGIRAGGGELVFYGVRVHVRQLPKITFGIMAGLRSPSGALTSEVETNETTGSATTPGFHAIEGAMNVGSPGVNVPEFGYYAGPAAAITARQGSHLVHASLARWSANPTIVIFWFPATTTNHTALTSLAAYTATGHPLPTGNTTTGLG